MFKTLIDMVTAPTAAFAAIREKPSILFPMLIVIGSVVSIQVGYFMNVDYELFIDQTVEQILRANPDAPEEAIRANYESMTPGTLAGISAASTAVLLLVVTALTAVYLNLMAKLSFAETRFTHWFSLCWWTATPTAFIAIAAWAAILAASNGQISLRDLSPLSFNSLLFQSTGPWAGLLDNINLITIWSMVLLVLGYRHWTGSGLAKSACVALVPSGLLYGIWALTIAF